MFSIQFPGRNVFLNSFDSEYYEIISQSTSFGAGLGKHDVEIVLPYYIAMEKIYTALYEVLAIGGNHPHGAVMNIFSEDQGIRDEIIRCGQDISSYLRIPISFQSEVIKGLSTSFVISLFSKVKKDDLKANKARNGYWIYFLKSDEDELDAINLNYYVPLDVFKNLVETKGIEEVYLLKNENVKQGVARLIQLSGLTLAENRKSGFSQLSRVKEGRGFLLLTPYKIKQKQLNNLTFHEVGCLYNKG